jgi:hypothetical protein
MLLRQSITHVRRAARMEIVTVNGWSSYILQGWITWARSKRLPPPFTTRDGPHDTKFSLDATRFKVRWPP